MNAPIRVLPIPDHRPPALLPGERPVPAIHPMYVQEGLALDFRSDAPPAPPVADRELPDPAVWSRGVAQALIEVMAGQRPPASVVRLTTPQVYLAVSRRYGVIARRAEAAAGRGHPAANPFARRLAVLRIRCCRSRHERAEVAVVLQDGHRVRTMALELVAFEATWRVATLQIA